MSVYFAMSRKDGTVKIGHSTDPEKRIAHVSWFVKEDLILLRTSPGDRMSEAWCHYKFEPSLIKGEWFFFDREMMTVTIPNEADATSILEKDDSDVFSIKTLRSLMGDKNVKRVAEATGINYHTLLRFANGERTPRAQTLDVLRAYLRGNT